MGHRQFLDLYKDSLARDLPISRPEALKIFNDLFWHRLDGCPLKRVPIEALRHHVTVRTKDHSSAPQRIDNVVGALIWHLRELDFLDKDGTVLPRGREFLIEEHPKQSQLWLAVRDIWSNRLALAITVIGLLSGLLAIAQWLGWLPQRLPG